MKIRFIHFVLILSLLGLGYQSKADHIYGMDITYKCSPTNDSILKVTVSFYRDCKGCYILGQSPKCGTAENCNTYYSAPIRLSLNCNTSFLDTFTFTRTGIEDITGLCSKEKSKCEYPCAGSFPQGIEKHTFTGTIDLRKYMKNGCCNFRIDVKLIARSNNITTGVTSGGFYSFLDVNACTKSNNSSPQFTNEPIPVICCNKPFYYNMGASDTADNDSLSYSFAESINSVGNPFSYYSPFSSTCPLSAYFPAGKAFPFNSPNADPPQGLFLDKYNGDLIFTPVDCSQGAVVVLQVDEWRKDTKGKYQNISTTRRDIVINVQTCPNDNPPKITNKIYNYAVCEGDKICFDITSADKVFTPPPPATAPPPDTILLTWNYGIPGASFTIKDKNAREKTGVFCWTPKKGMASDIPYTFTINAKTETCPLRASSTRAFSIKVGKKAKTNLKINYLGCNTYSLESIPDSNFEYPASYQWNILDTLGNLLPDNVAIINSVYNNSFLKRDTVLIKKGGKFYVRHIISNYTKCPSYYYDTIVVPDYLNSKPFLGNDTILCSKSISIQSSVKSGLPPYKYQWYTSSKNKSDTFSNLTLYSLSTLTKVFIDVKDANGCKATDSIKILSFDPPKISLGKDIIICQNDSVSLTAGAFANYHWSTGETSQKIFINKEGNYSLTVVDSNGCKANDTMYLKTLPLPKITLGNDTFFCKGDSIKLFAGNFKKYLWNIGNTTSGFYAKAQGYYQVIVTDSNNCKATKGIYILISALPKPELGNDTFVCQKDSIKLKPGLFSSYKWNTGQTAQNIFAKTQKLFLVNVIDEKGCKGADSLFVSVFPLPKINLGRDTSLCIGDSIKLDAGSFTSYKWNNNKTTRTITVKTQGNYSAEVTNFNGCKNSDDIFLTFKKCSGSIGVSTLKNVKVYPNPAIDILTIEFYNSGSNAKISIQDLNGKTILKKDVSTKGLVSEQINIKNFERGYYIVDIKTDEGSFSGKVLVK